MTNQRRTDAEINAAFANRLKGYSAAEVVNLLEIEQSEDLTSLLEWLSPREKYIANLILESRQ